MSDALHAVKGQADALAVIVTALLQAMPDDQRASFSAVLGRLAQHARDAVHDLPLAETYFESYDDMIQRAQRSATHRL